MLIFFVFIIGFKMSELSINNVITDDRSCKMNTISETHDKDPVTMTEYIYDMSNNLIFKKWKRSGNMQRGVHYEYLGKILFYSIIDLQTGCTDTTFYFYDVRHNLTSTVEHERNRNGLLTIRKNTFVYNSNDLVTCSVTHETSSSSTTLIDSTQYEYINKNVTTVKELSMADDNKMHSRTLNILYDTMKNYHKTMGLPPTSFLFWSENNIIQIKNVDIKYSTITINNLKYNESGYPIEYTQTTDQQRITVIITYQCQ